LLYRPFDSGAVGKDRTSTRREAPGPEGRGRARRRPRPRLRPARAV